MIHREVSMRRFAIHGSKGSIAILSAAVALTFGAAAPQRASANATAVMFCPGNMGYPNGLTTSEINGYRASGMTTMILFSMSVSANGDFVYGGLPIVQNGVYNGPSNWPGLLSQCRTSPSSIGRIEMCIGGWGDASYTNIKNRIAADGTGSGTVLYRNLQALKSGLGIDAIDYDDEQTYDSGSAVSFGNMVGAVGMKVTLCPYTNSGYWSAVKSGLGGTVDAIYLQCYDGGAGNDVGAWNNYFGGMKVIPGYWDYERDATFQNKMLAWKNNGSVGGFLWPSNTGGSPPADGGEMLQYANWIHSSLDSNTPAAYSYVASENQTVNFAAPVDAAYGANSSFFFKYAVKGSFTFNNTTFGGDPIFGVAKAGYSAPFWQVAGEGGSAATSVPVEAAYGGNGAYVFNWGTSGSITFTNAAWGGDPAPNVVKAGYIMPYTQCAGENGSVTFNSPADLAFGANGHYYFKHAFTGTITFSNASFGGDPIPNVAKGGYYRPSH
ncbi:hypothetical protein CCAX7_13310 [Capsulimonas corticalis]|uniref:Uncharacterized protein n=1 Tax=Capsulimonas corticalis TaxID=2219043 RepID=A0A402D4S6_9BACT|nr:hypothetical protein [Capsulimonas corticalis]BDI29280.1 hypothetical protein CCAX7_13310 [Capsulimonas corticalis]